MNNRTGVRQRIAELPQLDCSAKKSRGIVKSGATKTHFGTSRLKTRRGWRTGGFTDASSPAE
jgi:hypothetical protein